MGIIAWLPDTTTINSVLFDEADKQVADKVRAEYCSWIDRFGGYTKVSYGCICLPGIKKDSQYIIYIAKCFSLISISSHSRPLSDVPEMQSRRRCPPK